MPAKQSNSIATPAPYISLSQWGAIAYDLLMDAEQYGVSDVCDTYGITQHQLEELQANPRFREVYQEVERDLTRLGENARFISRVRMLTENMLPGMFNRATDARTETKDALAIFKTFASLARLDPATDGTRSGVDAGFGSGVGTFTLVLHSNIPGLNHLGSRVIEATDAEVKCLDVQEAL